MFADEVVIVRLPVHGVELWPTLRSAGLALTGATRVVVLKGEGIDFFHDEPQGTPSAEAEPLQASPDAQSLATSPDADAAIGWLRRPDLITIAVITGRATAAGLFLSLACDLRIAADDASLAISDSYPVSHNSPGRPDLTTAVAAHAFERLADALGYALALELALTGRRLSGRQAADCGIVNLAVPADQLDAAVSDLLSAVQSTTHTAATQAKALLAASGEHRRQRMEEVAAGLGLAGDAT